MHVRVRARERAAVEVPHADARGDPAPAAAPRGHGRPPCAGGTSGTRKSGGVATSRLCSPFAQRADDEAGPARPSGPRRTTAPGSSSRSGRARGARVRGRRGTARRRRRPRGPRSCVPAGSRTSMSRWSAPSGPMRAGPDVLGMSIAFRWVQTSRKRFPFARPCEIQSLFPLPNSKRHVPSCVPTLLLAALRRVEPHLRLAHDLPAVVQHLHHERFRLGGGRRLRRAWMRDSRSAAFGLRRAVPREFRVGLLEARVHGVRPGADALQREGPVEVRARVAHVRLRRVLRLRVHPRARRRRAVGLQHLALDRAAARQTHGHA